MIIGEQGIWKKNWDSPSHNPAETRKNTDESLEVFRRYIVTWMQTTSYYWCDIHAKSKIIGK